MKVAYFSPMPPAKTGVAHYSSMLVPELRKHVELELNPATRQPGNVGLYQLGNNPQHEFVYREAVKSPGVIVLHDIVLHHLIVEMTLARGDADGYIEAMRANHGEMGVAWAKGRIIGLHDEIANFLMPASIDIANRSRAVIVHNDYAAQRLRELGVKTPVVVVGHPTGKALGPGPKALAGRDVIGFFGFLTSAKRAEVVLEAFRSARAKNPKLQLLVVGEAAPNIEVPRGEGITVTGYVPDDQFDAYYDKVDRLVNLRYPSAGESSGTLIRAFEKGKPVAVSDYAQFAELPDDTVTKIPFVENEVELLADFFSRDLPSPAAAQRKWLEENASMEKTVAGYLEALECGGRAAAMGATQSGAMGAALQIFPNVALQWDGTTVTLTNRGESTIRAAEYGEPGYRAILKLDDRDRWIELPRDLRPGESVDIPFEGEGRLTLTHALQGIPILDETPAAEVEFRRVR